MRVSVGNNLPSRKHILTATGRYRAATDRIADAAQLQVVAIDRAATGGEHPVVTGFATAVRHPVIGLPVGSHAIDKDVRRTLVIWAGWPAAMA